MDHSGGYLGIKSTIRLESKKSVQFFDPVTVACRWTVLFYTWSVRSPLLCVSHDSTAFLVFQSLSLDHKCPLRHAKEAGKTGLIGEWDSQRAFFFFFKFFTLGWVVAGKEQCVTCALRQHLVLPPESHTQQVLNGCYTPETPILIANVQMDEFLFSSGRAVGTWIPHLLSCHSKLCRRCRIRPDAHLPAYICFFICLQRDRQAGS